MRKINLLITFALLATMLTGCISEERRDEIINVLYEHGVIHEDWEHIDTKEVCDPLFGYIRGYEVVYKDSEDVLTSICIDQLYTTQDGNDSYYPIEVLSNMEVGDDVSGNEVVGHNYEPSDKTKEYTYEVRYNKILMWEVWKLEETTEGEDD